MIQKPPLSDFIYTHPFLQYWLDRVPVDVRRCLDIGTGTGIVGAMLSVYREPEVVTGIEIFQPYIDKAKKQYTSIIKGDCLDELQKIPTKSYDIVTWFEVLEHLEKEKSIVVLKELERVAHSVYVSTPPKFNPEFAHDGNEAMKHLCLWKPNEFRELGYTVRGFGWFANQFGFVGRVFLPSLCQTQFAWKIGVS